MNNAIKEIQRIRQDAKLQHEAANQKYNDLVEVCHGYEKTILAQEERIEELEKPITFARQDE